MRTKKVNRYFCDFCRKGKLSKSWMLQHEHHCYKNQNRVPYEGELTYASFMGRTIDYGHSDGLPVGLRWLEWTEWDEAPKWWPGPGKIYHAGEWYAVPGWRINFSTGAHGYAGGPPPTDVWPHYGSGTPLNEIAAVERWDAFHPDMAPFGGIPEEQIF